MNPVHQALLRVQRRTVLTLEACGRRLSRRAPRPRHLLVGERGELEALFFLREQGYLVVERRWHTPELRGDLDLVAWDGKILCIVEVKTRTARDLTPARLAVDRGKQIMLRRMARGYRRTLPREIRWQTPIRFDVVSVYLLGRQVECELARGLFTLDEEGDRESPEFRM